MSRYRRVTPINLEEQERIINLRRINSSTARDTRQLRRPPFPHSPLSIFLEKLNRSGETRNVREIVTSTCFNLRGICQYVRTFADDMENLLNSVESIAPVVEGVVAGYSRSLKSKENPTFEKNEASANLYQDETVKVPQEPKANPVIEPITNPGKTPPFSGKMPTEEELKDFLSNPLVSSLMQVVAKNLATKR